MAKDQAGRIIILGMERFRKGPFEVKNRILATRERDGREVTQVIEQDPGAAGKSEALHLRRDMAAGGYIVKTKPVTKSKLTRFLSFSAAAETPGEVLVLRGPWNHEFYQELEYFSGDGLTHDDIVDCASGGHEELESDQMPVGFSLGSVAKPHQFNM